MLRSAFGVIFSTALVLTLVGVSPCADADEVDLTGKWSINFGGGIYHIRQVGNAVWWMGQSKNNGKDWTNVGHGTIKGQQLTVKWADVPHGAATGSGTLTLELVSKGGQVVTIRKTKEVGDGLVVTPGGA